MRVLMILSRFPYPLEKGDKLRAFQHLQMLSKEHEVYLIAISDIDVKKEDYEKVRPYCKNITVFRQSLFNTAVNLAGGFFRNLPLQVAYFFSSSTNAKISEIARSFKPDVVFCQLIRTALYAKEVECPVKVIDYQDAFSAGTAQRAQKASFLLKPLFNRELKLVRKFEQMSYGWFNRHIVISANDRDQLAVQQRNSVSILPNGIDVASYYAPDAVRNIDLLFVGNMQYPPNVDAALYLVKDIMPRIWKSFPETRLVLCGANPVKQVRELASDRVTVTGWVEDVRDYYSRSRVFIAPMRIGTGLQNKLLEAMATGIPCITTTLSSGPLGGQPGEDHLTGDTPDEIALQIERLLKDEPLRRKIGEKGNQLVSSRFSFESAGKILSGIIGK